MGEEYMEKHLEAMVAEIRAGEAQLFDVREQDEWDAGHLQLAQLTPLSGLRSGVGPTNANAKRKTYLHCRSGNRVLMAKPILESMGFETVIALNEGFKDLVKAGLERADS